MRTIVVLCVMLAPGLAAAQVNKCIDAKGKTVGYAAECPQGTRAEQTNIKSNPAAPAAGSQKSAGDQKSLSERDADFRKRQMEKQEDADKAKAKSTETAQRQRACEDAKSYLAAVQQKQRITKTDPKTGERVFLDDADYPAEVARAQKNVDGHCKS